MEDKTTASLAALKLDEWLNFKLDPEVGISLLLINIFQGGGISLEDSLSTWALK